ncbi:[NiFe]-hydrogenase assembly chaperone HybE [Escherichia coli]
MFADFTLFEGEWTGCVITPWMLVQLSSRAGSTLAAAQSSEKIGLQLPYRRHDLYRWRTGRCFAIPLLFADVTAFAQYVD